jgi:hypothetical protein
MHSLSFSCQETLPLGPEEIVQQILDLSKWPEFHGCWPIPGIKAAEFEVRTPEVMGTRIRVTNRDGSTHVEEIREWEPSHRLRLHMHQFSPPLSRLATGFDETWEFEQVRDGTRVIRSLELHPKSALARLPLRLIAVFLKRAIVRHLREMKPAAGITEEPTG